VRFHDLRHTCVTLLLTKDVHPKYVQELLGHTTVAITLDTYSPMIPGMGTQAAVLYMHAPVGRVFDVLERVMILEQNRIGMGIIQLARFPAIPRFPHSQAIPDRVHNSL